jgi:uncharacterized membrane protein
LAARQGGSPDAVVVAVVVELVVVGAVVDVVDVGVLVVLVAVVVVVGLPAAVAVVEGVDEPPALPHAVTKIAHAATKGASANTSGFLMADCSGMVSSAPSPCAPRTSACHYPDATMDRSEELRQTPQRPPRNRFLTNLERHIPFWEPQLVVACTIALQLSLSNQVTIGPTWLLPALEGALLIGLVIVSPRPNVRHSPIRRRVAIGMIAFVSAANIASLVLLSHRLLHGGKENGHQLILSGIVLWCTNVLLFGLWYWETDRGGPVAREKGERDFPDFLFPQMTSPRWAPKDWMPRLIDYLYVSLTNATAFSPTDTMPLTATAKWLMGTQSIVSLVTVGLVVARAVNILS